MKKVGFSSILLLILAIILYTRSNPITANAPNSYPVHNLDTGLNYTSIQVAVDASETMDGHRIFVEKGAYYEHVTVNKRARAHTPMLCDKLTAVLRLL